MGVGWYESCKRKAKILFSRELAEHYKNIKYTQLNSDVFTGVLAVYWQQMEDEYMESKKVQRVTEGALYEITLWERAVHFNMIAYKLKTLKSIHIASKP